MPKTSLAQLGALFSPQHAAKLQVIERQAQAHFQAGSALESLRHQQRLVELDRDLSNRMALMQAQAQIETEQDLARSIIKQMEERSATRNEMAKMILAAGIQARLGRLEHERRLEEQYLSKLHDYLFGLLREQRRPEAERAIDELYSEAMADGV